MPMLNCIWDARAVLGEGGLWDPASGLLWWVDIKGGTINSHDPMRNENRSFTAPARTTALGLTRDHRLVASTDLGFALIDPGRGTVEPICHPEPTLPGNRFNDGKVDPHGNFWAGTMDDSEATIAGSVYRLDPGGNAQRILTDIAIPNGPAFDPVSGAVYLSDTALRETYRLTLDGDRCERTLFARFGEEQGHPDGMTVDTEGHLWIAFWGGWCIRRLSPDGEIVAEIRLPVSQCTSCTFAGAALDTLYVTSARIGLDTTALGREPLAGGLFRIEGLGVRGVPPSRYGAIG